ncbi:MAG TPA: CHASE2 domain-containing protein [Rhodanobacteraceae bacterium]|nr:CHASE2 domain-containing protein [Rhodanobacteraceae bacterium]
MLRQAVARITGLFNAVTSRLGYTFIGNWKRGQKSYRRPLSWLTLRLGFAFYPLFALAAVGWLGWDYCHDRSLGAAENAVFDQVIRWRPDQPSPSGQVVVVEIDECSINYYRARGEGGWPWPRSRHADLLDALDRAGARAVGYDILFSDPSTQNHEADAILEAMAAGAKGRFVFASARLATAYDVDSTLRVSNAPSAFPLHAAPRTDPTVALLLPYGKAMRQNSALVNIDRSDDGILRDVPLRVAVGDYALPSLALRLVTGPDPAQMARYPASLRINWRMHSPLPMVSAANLIEGRTVCGGPGQTTPTLKGRTVLVGYTAAGLNDAKPTPVNYAMAGVAVHAEAVEALLNHTAVWMPPASTKYLLAMLLVLLTGYSFYRGEPAWELDDVFVAGNLGLLLVAFIGISFFAIFLDIFAALGFAGLCFGLCRSYAQTQRGRAIGNDDYRDEYDQAETPWLALARLRFVPDPGLDAAQAERRLREFRRRLRRFMYRGTDAVALDCVVEYDTWFWNAMMDITVFMWGGSDRDSVLASARRELDALHAYLTAAEAVLPDDGSVRIATLICRMDDEHDTTRYARTEVSHAVGAVLALPDERKLQARNAFPAAAASGDAVLP